MPHHAMTTSAGASDHLADAGDAAGTAVQSTGRAASEIIPAVGDFLSRTVYTTSYAVSYGVVFPAMLIARAVPRENALVQGLTDGALAARDRVFGWDDGHEEIDETEAHHAEAEGDGPAATGGRRRRTHRSRGGRKASR